MKKAFCVFMIKFCILAFASVSLSQSSLDKGKELFEAQEYKLGRAYEKKKMKQEAIKEYQTLLELTPNHSTAKDAKKRLSKLD